MSGGGLCECLAIGEGGTRGVLWRLSPGCVVVHFNGLQADEWAQKGKLRIDGRTYRESNALRRCIAAGGRPCYVSNFMKAQLQQRIPALSRVRSTVVPNFHERRSEPVAPVDVKGDLITIGTLRARKNHRYLLHVLAHAAHLGKCYTLTVVGETLRGELEQLTRELNISKLVQFIGFQPDASRFLGGHRAYVHSAINETFGIVLIRSDERRTPDPGGTRWRHPRGVSRWPRRFLLAVG